MKINYDDFLESLNDDDVFELFYKLFKVQTLKNALNVSFNNKIKHELVEQLNSHGINTLNQTNPKGHVTVNKSDIWFDDGADCRILRVGADGWKKGRVKINVSVEFVPDEPEPNEYQSPLDEIRQEMQSED
jgi:hypothetical protein